MPVKRGEVVLTHAEIDLVQCYFLEHKEEFDEEDRRLREYTEEQIWFQRPRFPQLEGTPEAVARTSVVAGR